MGKSTHLLKLPRSVKEAAAELAQEAGVSLNQFIAAAVAEKVGTLRPAHEFFGKRTGNAKPADLLKVLEKVPTRPPVPGDETE